MQIWKAKLNTVLLIGICAGIGASCNQSGDGAGRVTPGAVTTSGGTTTSTDTPTTEGKLPEEAKTSVSADDLTVGNPSTVELFTKEAGENACAVIEVTALVKTVATADVKITAAVQATAAMEDVGTIKPTEGFTGADGKLEFAYCSGSSEGRAAIVFKSGTLIKNSAVIRISKKPIYKFVYVRSDADPMLSGPAAADKPESVFLNLYDSGPQDCTNLYFKLTKSDKPVAATTIRFRTQIDPPKRAKLEKRDGTGLQATDTLTQKKYGYYDSKSTGAGEFAVPVCAGVSLGSIFVSGTYTDEESRSYTAHSPVVRITAGLTNYINLSLTFDPSNARTLRAYYNTNSDYTAKFSVQLGARQDGESIEDYPVLVASEVGRITIDNEGKIDPAKGSVGVQLHALHLNDNYPFLVYPKTSGVSDKVFKSGTGGSTVFYPAAQTRCDPKDLADWAHYAGRTNGILYKELRENWRSTLVYAIRGQEHFNDANKNGIYDQGGHGFWDKNQNGVFDAGDQITYDPTGTNSAANFNHSGEWFVDLPSPFIDVNENAVFDTGIDIVIGDEYQAPNGKRDSDTVVWKNEVFPISMGPSPYGLLRQKIFPNTTASVYDEESYKDWEPNVDLRASRLSGTFGTTYPVFGAHLDPTHNSASLGGLDYRDFWGTSLSLSQASLNYDSAASPPFSIPSIQSTLAGSGSAYDFVVFAHDLCGNVLPGGTTLELSFQEIKGAEYGPRVPIGVYSMQEPDTYYEPSRRLLREATAGAAKATLNFNATDHVSKENSYPVVGQLIVPGCSAACTGDFVVAGRSCDSWEGYVNLTVVEPVLDATKQSENLVLRQYMRIPEVRTCVCAAGASFSKGACTCPNGYTRVGTSCVAAPTAP